MIRCIVIRQPGVRSTILDQTAWAMTRECEIDWR
jgi:hypothetical protein